MGLYDFFFKKPVRIQDDFFGTLYFADFRDASRNHFRGRGFFAPANSETDFHIEADLEGPTPEQKAFYRNIEDHFEDYVEKIRPLIEDEFRNWKEDFRIGNFAEAFSLVSITIPRMDKRPLTWHMAFETVHDLNHQVTIDFTDQDPTGILVDG